MSLESLSTELDPATTGSEMVTESSYTLIEGSDKDAAKTFKEKFDDVPELLGAPQDWLDDPLFYKTVLSGEGDEATRVHENLGAYLKTTDPTDRNMYKGRLIAAYWQLYAKLMIKAVHPDVPLSKKMLVRFGALLPNLLDSDHRKVLTSIFLDKRLDEAVWYADEWVAMVSSGEINALVSDEAVAPKKEGGALLARLRAQVEKHQGRYEANATLLHDLEASRKSLLGQLKLEVDNLLRVEPSQLLPGVSAPFSESQKGSMNKLANLLRDIVPASRTFENNYQKFLDSYDDLTKSQKEMAGVESGVGGFDDDAIRKETAKIEQIVRMCVGRQGNHFPILAGQFFAADPKNIGMRENVVRIMAEIEALDVNLFKREFRGRVNRVPPHVILVPCYGNMGICWEPYERSNRATSRGRIAVPMYAQDFRVAILSALADYRWSYAKEVAAHYWMEEGLTGQYYQWFSETKQKGDLRLSFIENYIVWITKESEGMQKLDREIRGVFWRNAPFSPERRESLKMRGFVYDDLYKKDLNRAKSSGY